MSRNKGFTLIEVMVALMVIAIALPALLSTMYKHVDGTAYLRDKSIAHWVASNRMEETRIRAQRLQQVVTGKRSGVTSLADRDWFWWLESTPTEVENFNRIEVRVSLVEDEDAQPLYSLVAFAAGSNGGGDGD